LGTKLMLATMWVTAWPEYDGRGNDVRPVLWPMAMRQCAGQRVREGRMVLAYCLRPRHSYLATVTKTPRTDRRSEGWARRARKAGESARRDGVARDVARVAGSARFNLNWPCLTAENSKI
jgi:hypothetical protein